MNEVYLQNGSKVRKKLLENLAIIEFSTHESDTSVSLAVNIVEYLLSSNYLIILPALLQKPIQSSTISTNFSMGAAYTTFFSVIEDKMFQKQPFFVHHIIISVETITVMKWSDINIMKN